MPMRPKTTLACWSACLLRRVKATVKMLTMAFDTSPEAAAIQQEIFRRMTTEERLRFTLQMCDDMREVALAGLRSRRPELSEEELKFELIRLWYGYERKP